ncbi:hypothetical protein A6A04_03740 [Paramagnetospirillum marisnigri]|uniref:MaoC-like domain-containing protein n=1 Tax=Paramagnetospirillum marisnigri TaxID=1285242 RepID=A0A178MM79_9PROT|nr:MaoC/PaaZ C-terminal domain-containing protein [Paramagnetospirillum marisnigri]OAN49237.1 hypothetical protein A6A04_03740 [Paramagnetospirillum marisnigri]
MTASKAICFEPEVHEAFARLSQDFNPQHMDALVARRLFYGTRVVHGTHSLMAALDRVAATYPDFQGMADLKVSFRGPVRLGQGVTFDLSRTGNSVTVDVLCDGQQASRIRLALGTTATDLEIPAIGATPPVCIERSEADLQGLAGEVPLTLDLPLYRRLFPSLSARLPHAQAAILLASTRLVGMDCPGLHSIYTGLKLTFGVAETHQPMVLRYQVAHWQPQFRLLTMTVDGGGAKGSIECFLRPPRVDQADIAQLRSLVQAGEFKGRRALVVGGARGLGEVAAKLVAIGGGSVVITYLVGRDDAERIVSDLVVHGYDARCLPLNVLEPTPLDDDGAGRFTDVFYFASPHIDKGAETGMDATLLRRYFDYYCDGLVRTVEALAPRLDGRARLIYPSTIFIDQPEKGFAEYACAKAAGEVTVAHLAASLPGRIAVIRRLPRLRTDQTQSLSGPEAADPAPVILDLVRCAAGSLD